MSKNPTAPLARMRTAYQEGVVPEMLKRFNLKNPMQVPKLVKVVVNMGVNDAKEDIKSIDVASADLAAITGQKPQVRRAKKSISNFKLRAGMPIGVRVTLRGTRMYEFLDRFINTAIPRIRDFRGLDPRAFDGRGNYNLGLTEQHIFPEINLEKSPKLRGFNVTIVTDAGEDAKARELLTLFGMPFKTPEKDGRKQPVKKA